MTISSTTPYSQFQAQAAGANADSALASGANSETREQFDKFVGGTFFRQMLTEMQKSVGKSEYFNGGQAEEMFRSELNSHLADKMAESSAQSFTGPMFDLFTLQRS